MSSRAALVALALVLTACEGAAPQGTAPLATLSAPSSCDLDTEMVLDASGSTDPDGDIVLYRFVIGDGSPARDETQPQPSLTHICHTAGLIEAAVQVIDSAQNSSWARATISVRRP